VSGAGPVRSTRTGVRDASAVSGSGAPAVIKLGGRALEAPGALAALADDLAAHCGHVVVVHGGGAEVSGWCGRLGIEPAFHDGLRVTDAPTLDVVVAVLAGLANKRLVAALRAAGLDAVGLAALDGGIVEVAPHPEAAALGHVGAVRTVRTRLILRLWKAGCVPVLASVAAHAGALLNVNADDVAAALAAELRAHLVLLSDTPGLVVDGALVRALALEDVEAALARPDVTGGMRPKLRAAALAVTHGAPGVTLAHWDGPGSLARALSGDVGTTLLSHPTLPEPSSAAVSPIAHAFAGAPAPSPPHFATGLETSP
jgi:acetylglutamate kinase